MKWVEQIRREECQEQKNTYKEHLQYNEKKWNVKGIVFEPR